MRNLMNAASLCLGVTTAVAAAAVNVPLTVESTRLVGDPPMIEIRLLNNAPKTAVAWSFDSTVVFADGNKNTVTMNQDCYPQLSLGISGQVKPIAPGDSLTVVFAPSGTGTPVKAEVVPTAVVYSNRTSEGDPGRVRRIFQARSEDAKALAQVLSIARDTVARRGLSHESVQAIVQQLQASPSIAESDSTIRQGAARNFRMLLTPNQGSGPSLAKAYADLVQLVERQHRVAVEQSKPQ